jgi:hypothetical protein
VDEIDNDGPEDEAVGVDVAPIVANAEEDIVVISSDDEDSGSVSSNQMTAAAAKVEVKVEEDDEMDPREYGDLANLEFLLGSENAENTRSVIDDPYHQQGRRARSRNANRNEVIRLDSDGDDNNDDDGSDDNGQTLNSGAAAGVARAPSDEYMGDSSDDCLSDRPRKRRRTRLDKHSRDGRWYPGRKTSEKNEVSEKEWYDTDSDLPSSSKPAARDSSGLADANDESKDESSLL